MATHSKQELKTVAVLFMDHPDDPDGVLEFVTPTVAEMLRRMEELDDAGRADAMRVLRATRDGLFQHTAAEVEAWTPAQRRAVIDALPQYVAAAG